MSMPLEVANVSSTSIWQVGKLELAATSLGVGQKRVGANCAFRVWKETQATTNDMNAEFLSDPMKNLSKGDLIVFPEQYLGRNLKWGASYNLKLRC